MEKTHQFEKKKQQKVGMKVRNSGNSREHEWEAKRPYNGKFEETGQSMKKRVINRKSFRSRSREKWMRNGVNVRNTKGKDATKRKSDYQGKLYSNANASIGNRSDSYLEKGVYKVVLKQRNRGYESVPNYFTQEEDSETYSSDYALEFGRREQCNPDFLEYYMNFGDPYVMSNGEIANEGYFDRCAGVHGRLFNQCGNPHYAPQYEGMQRYFPFYSQDAKRHLEPYIMYTPRFYGNNYTQGNEYSQSYYTPVYQQPYQDSPAQRYPTYEEEDNSVTPYYAPTSQCAQDNDMLNIINLNSSFFVYNSNVHINTVRHEVYDTTLNVPNESFSAPVEISKNSPKDY